MDNNPGCICLDPMGNPDPIDLINLETSRIPFKLSNLAIFDWEHTFSSWPNTTPGWRNWYLRMSASKISDWDEYEIGQCIYLSWSNMASNESILIAASHFWSDTLNAFLFGHGPMTSTLADVMMLIGLNISASQSASGLLCKPSHQLETKSVSGWKCCIAYHSRTG